MSEVNGAVGRRIIKTLQQQAEVLHTAGQELLNTSQHLAAQLDAQLRQALSEMEARRRQRTIVLLVAIEYEAELDDVGRRGLPSQVVSALRRSQQLDAVLETSVAVEDDVIHNLPVRIAAQYGDTAVEVELAN